MSSPEEKTTVNHINPGTVNLIAETVAAHFRDDSPEMYQLMRLMVLERMNTGEEVREELLSMVRIMALGAGLSEDDLARLNERNVVVLVKSIQTLKQSDVTRDAVKKTFSSVPPVRSSIFGRIKKP